MRKLDLSLADIAEQIKNMKGDEVKMNINRGRKKIENYVGVIESIYPSIFTVKVNDSKTQKYLSVSYNEVLCGQVKLSKLNNE